MQKDRTLLERLQARLDEAAKRLPEGAGPEDVKRLKGELLELKDELRHATSAFKV